MARGAPLSRALRHLRNGRGWRWAGIDELPGRELDAKVQALEERAPSKTRSPASPNTTSSTAADARYYHIYAFGRNLLRLSRPQTAQRPLSASCAGSCSAVPSRYSHAPATVASGS